MVWLGVGVAGALGAMARFGVGQLVEHWFGAPSWVATWGVNVVGSALLGGLAALAMVPGALTPEWRAVLGVGFLGAFTTFSTFSVETVDLLRHGKAGLAFGVVGANVVCGLLAAWFGMVVVRGGAS